MLRLWSKSQRRYGTLIEVVFRDDEGMRHTLPIKDLELIDAPTEEALMLFAQAAEGE